MDFKNIYIVFFARMSQSIRSSVHRFFLIALASLAMVACENFDPQPVTFNQSDIVQTGEVHTLEIDGRVLSSLPQSKLGANPDRVALGRMLFWDPVLSGDRDVACATCHLPEHGYSDGIAQSIGVGGIGRSVDRQVGHTGFVRRNSQGLINTGWNGIGELGLFDSNKAPMFWDNRVESLALQALEPILDLKEMRGEVDAMSADQISAMQEFVIAGCADCHSGPMFSDFKLHVLGAAEHGTAVEPDDGDGDFAFRTPTLRQLDFTAPYFHNGQFETLAQAIDFYDQTNNSRNPNVASSALDSELLDVPEMDDGRGAFIQQFLDTLNDADFDRTVHEAVPSGLTPGGL